MTRQTQTNDLDQGRRGAAGRGRGRGRGQAQRLTAGTSQQGGAQCGRPFPYTTQVRASVIVSSLLSTAVRADHCCGQIVNTIFSGGEEKKGGRKTDRGPVFLPVS